MENKGCITCRKCEQVRSNFFCGRTRLSQKQLYNKHGFCSDYEPKEQIEKPMTKEEWFCRLSTEEKAKVFANATYSTAETPLTILWGGKEAEQKKWELWLKQPHR